MPYEDQGLARQISEDLLEFFLGKFANEEQILVLGCILLAWGKQICEEKQYPEGLIPPKT
jgi:hypothetical protein